MGLENTTAKYEISIVKSGDGASAAIADFNQVKAAAMNASSGLKENANSFNQLNTATIASKAALDSFRTGAILVGSQTMPGLTGAVITVSSALKSLRAVTALTGAGLGSLTAAGAVFTTGFFAAGEAVKMWNAQLDEGRSKLQLFESQSSTLVGFLDKISKLNASGKLTDDQFYKFSDTLAAAAGKGPDALRKAFSSVRADVNGLVPTEQSEQAIQRLRSAYAQLQVDVLSGYERERAAALKTYTDTIAQADAELAKVKQTANDRVEAEKAASNNRLAAETVYQNQIEQINQRERQAKEKVYLQDLVDYDKLMVQKGDLRDQMLLDTVSGYDRERLAVAQRYNAEIDAISDLQAQLGLSKQSVQELTQLATEGFRRQTEAIGETKVAAQQYKIQIDSTQDIAQKSVVLFADGMSSALVDFTSGTKSAKEAFKDFALSFVQQVEKMIIQALILKALKSAFGSSGLFAAEGGSFMAASGGSFPRMMAAGGMQGVNSVSQATYFPRFNVVAGEAGQEMLTVLAKPRMMKVGGMQAVVGNAGGNRLAITNADELAGGAGGTVHIQVSMEAGLRAEIVDESVQGAVVTVTKNIGQDTKLRRAVRNAST